MDWPSFATGILVTLIPVGFFFSYLVGLRNGRRRRQ